MLIIIIAVSGALMSYMYNQCLSEGMVFGRIGEWLDGDEWYKSILGGCIYCNSAYMTTLMLILYIYVLPLWIFFTIISASFFMIALIDKFELL